ncbi:SLOG family protein [Sphingobium yanoikuyae]|uniref:SLOG family protein n=1 Tax=Sphingobium yanoikuyae TaxID=13690 RepID=UPI00289D45DC|nr:SLOG family protein [Sphingobium yanoikuyae]
MKGGRILICGGRTFNDQVAFARVMEGREPSVIINGGAAGADRLARMWAGYRAIATFTFPADWERMGPSAGPRRNQRMIDEGKPDLVIAFPGGRGTADMIRRARAAGIPVIVASSTETGGKAVLTRFWPGDSAKGAIDPNPPNRERGNVLPFERVKQDDHE